ncbi:MAG TPA: hypothetical protein VE242_13160, partial [Chthoniobacterales bacterium]|nr:hypothetical protein [Chthoniobacterales bacterium]
RARRLRLPAEGRLGVTWLSLYKTLQQWCRELGLCEADREPFSAIGSMNCRIALPAQDISQSQYLPDALSYLGVYQDVELAIDLHFRTYPANRDARADLSP